MSDLHEQAALALAAWRGWQADKQKLFSGGAYALLCGRMAQLAAVVEATEAQANDLRGVPQEEP